MTSKRLSGILAVLLIATLILSACGATPEPQTVDEGATAVPTAEPVAPTAEPEQEKVFTFGTTLGEETFDPVIIGRGAWYGVSYLVFETLVQHNQDMEIVPLLAESWDVSEDGRTWNFHLRQGVKFHDGTPLNAEAVKFSWERFLDPATAAKDTARLKAVESMEVVDEYTFAVTTMQAYPEFLVNLTDRATAVISPTAAKKHPVEDFGRKEPVGTGPYMFDKWVGTDRLELVANPDYWGSEKAHFDRFVFRIIPEAASLIAALEAGEVDFVSPVVPEDALRLTDNPDLTIDKYEAFLTLMYCMLVTVEPFSDVQVRHALNYAVDKEAIADALFQGYAKPTETVIFPGLPYRVAQPPYEYDPDKARQLLADAGYPDGFETELAYSPDFEKGKEVAEAVAAYLADVGVILDLVPMESAVISKYYRETEEIPGRKIFAVRKSAFGVDFNLTRLFSKSTWDDDNRSRYYNEEVERLLDEARYSFDEELRTKNYAEVQRIVWEDAPEIFLYTMNAPIATRADIHGLWFKPDGVPMMAGVYRE